MLITIAAYECSFTKITIVTSNRYTSSFSYGRFVMMSKLADLLAWAMILYILAYDKLPLVPSMLYLQDECLHRSLPAPGPRLCFVLLHYIFDTLLWSPDLQTTKKEYTQLLRICLHQKGFRDNQSSVLKENVNNTAQYTVQLRNTYPLPKVLQCFRSLKNRNHESALNILLGLLRSLVRSEFVNNLPRPIHSLGASFVCS